MTKFIAFLNRIAKTALWEVLAVALASLLVIVCVGYQIAVSKSATINNALNITASEIERSDEEEYQYFKREYDSEQKLEERYASVAKNAEANGLVLLKNDGALPLKEQSDVSLVFTGSVNVAYGSTGSSAMDTSGYSTLKDELSNVGLKVNEQLWNFYKGLDSKTYGRFYDNIGYKVREPALENYGGALDGASGTAIAVITRDTGEGKDINMANSDTMDGSYLTLSAQELAVLDKLTEMKQSGKIENIVVLLNTSATVQLDFLFGEYKDYDIDVDALMWIGNPGKYGLAAVAEALVGKVNPSGRITDTFVRDNLSSPAAASASYSGTFSQVYSNYIADYSNSLDSSQAFYGVYTEGIYVGYRYYETRYTDAVNGVGNTQGYDYAKDVAYPFGYGLSYSQFEYSDFTLTPSADGETFTVSVTVTNTGDYAGRETVQVYLQKPYDHNDENSVEAAAVELVGFAKTQELAPNGEGKETVTIDISREEFKSYDADNAKTYIVEDGTYYFTVADNAHDAANNILEYINKDAKTDRSTAAYMDVNASNNAMVGEAEEAVLDAESYSVSAETDAEITNRLDDVDINKYSGRGDNSVTYVSRGDWNGTFPAAAVSLAITEQMATDLTANKADLDGEAEMPQYSANNGISLVTMRGKEYDHEDWDKLLDQMSYGEQAELITNAGWTTVAVPSVNKPDTKEADGPVGIIYSTGKRSMPCQGIWAATFDKDIVKDIGDIIAEDTLNAGYTGIYANGVNIHRSPFGGRSAEYFSEDPYLSGIMSMNEIQGIQGKGVIVHVKHAAFNDMEDQRNGICIWLNEQEAREIMLEVFEYSLAPSKGNGHAVMSGFNRVGTDWAGADDALLNGILRGEFGFDGYCITDMADANGASYMTYHDGVMNGTDCWLGNGGKTALDSFSGSAAFAQKMRECCHRILYSVTNYSAAMNGITPDTPVGVAMPWWQATIIAVMAVVAVFTAVSGAMYIYCFVRSKLQKNKA